jgi:hypothetical protein
MSPAERQKAGEDDHNADVIADAVREAAAKHAAGDHRSRFVWADSKAVVSGEDASGIKDARHIASVKQLEETILNESVDQLTVDFVEMRPPLRGINFLPKANEQQWAAIIQGYYCIRCVKRHRAPNPPKCDRCNLTKEHRRKILVELERRMELRHAAPTPYSTVGAPVSPGRPVRPSKIIVPGRA